MAYALGYDHDVFVSFSRLDNQGEPGWVTTLVRHLDTEVRQRLGTKDLGIWIDRDLDGNHPLTPEIMQAIRRSATILLIVSPSYIASEWCARERNAFLGFARQCVSEGRIFIVRCRDIDPHILPPEFGDLIGFKFWTQDGDAGGVTRPLGLTDLKEPAYFAGVINLGDKLAQKLKEIRAARARSASSPGPARVERASPARPRDVMQVRRVVASVPKIAISYRRADTEVMAGRIRDRLAARYGEDAVFMDIDDIPYGRDFRVHIREAVVQSDVLLVIVGQRWLGTGRGGTARIDSETDFVRLEVETAMNNSIPIIPVLAGSGRMPQPSQLPESLKNFAFLNAAPVATGRDFHQHMERLGRGIDQILSDRRTTGPVTGGSRDGVAPPTGSARGERVADALRPDLSVFRDALFAPELVVIPAGEFMMGSTAEEDGGYEDERPQHRVTISERFALGRYPVTFNEYDRFCEETRWEKPADDNSWGRGRRPVINVSWLDAQAYVTWLSRGTGRAYRLPSESEWEYACRAGTTTRYSFGDAKTPDKANFADSSLQRTTEVGAYPANLWGLLDMHGNVFEWVEDNWHDNYRDAPSDGAVWKMQEQPTSRVVTFGAAAPGSPTPGTPDPPTAAGSTASAGPTMPGSE